MAAQFLDRIPVTESGQPRLSKDEIECLIVEDTGLEVGRHADSSKATGLREESVNDGNVILTTFRLIWMSKELLVSPASIHSSNSQQMQSNDSKSALALHLASVADISLAKKSLFASARVILKAFVDSAGKPAIKPSDKLPNRVAAVSVVIRGRADPEMVLKSINELLYMKSWQQDEHYQRLLASTPVTVPPAIPLHPNASQASPGTEYQHPYSSPYQQPGPTSSSYTPYQQQPFLPPHLSYPQSPRDLQYPHTLVPGTSAEVQVNPLASPYTSSGGSGLPAPPSSQSPHNQQQQQHLPVRLPTAPAAEVLPGAAPVAAGSFSPGPGRLSPVLAGVGGLLLREQQQQQQTDRSLQEAFTDLKALMAKASEMVSLAERMRLATAKARPSATAASNSTNSSGNNSSSGNLAPLVPGSASGESAASDSASGDLGAGEAVLGEEDLQDLLVSIGIADPVTKKSAGSHYHKELAKQLASFLSVPLERFGGTLPLTDVYCLFNRARGTELISPDDLLRACSLFDSLQLPVTLRRFNSGVMVVQQRSHSDDWVLNKIKELVQADGAMRTGVSIPECAQALRVTPVVAKEELLLAEEKGILCRDDARDGLRFYHNFFMDVTL